MKILLNKKIIKEQMGLDYNANLKDLDIKNSIISNLLISKFIKSIFCYELACDNATVGIVIKHISPNTMKKGAIITNPYCSLNTLRLYRKHGKIFGFENSAKKECYIYGVLKDKAPSYIPKVYFTYINEKKRKFIIGLEELKKDEHRCFNIFNKEFINNEDIELILDNLAHFHSLFLNNYDEIQKCSPLKINDKNFYYGTDEYFSCITDIASKKFPHLINKNKDIYEEFISHIGNLVNEFSSHMSLSHNDFSLRNICISNIDNKIKILDWETSCIQIPEHDVVEFLLFLLPRRLSKEEYDTFFEFYRKKLSFYTNEEVDKDLFMKAIRFSILEIAVNRMNLFLISEWAIKSGFIEDVYSNLDSLINYYIKVE